MLLLKIIFINPVVMREGPSPYIFLLPLASIKHFWGPHHQEFSNFAAAKFIIFGNIFSCSGRDYINICYISRRKKQFLGEETTSSSKIWLIYIYIIWLWACVINKVWITVSVSVMSNVYCLMIIMQKILI